MLFMKCVTVTWMCNRHMALIYFFFCFRYVSLCVNMIVGICMGVRWYYVALVWTGLMMALFMVRTLL